jgi:hypothetical protein
MYNGHFEYEGLLNTDIPLDDGDSLSAGSGSDDSLLNPDNWLQDDDGVWRPIDDSDDKVEVQMPAQRLPPLPPTFQVDSVHLDILELPEHLRSWQAAAFHLLSKDDRRTMFLEDGSPNWDHPLTVPALSGDISAFIHPPDSGHFGTELWAALHMLATASLWVRSADPSSIPPEAQELVWTYTLGLLDSAERFVPPNKNGTFNVPSTSQAPPVASGSTAAGSAGQSSSSSKGNSSSSKRWCRRH